MKTTFELTPEEVARACSEYVANKNPILQGKQVQVTLTSRGDEGLIRAKLVFDLPSDPSQP